MSEPPPVLVSIVRVIWKAAKYFTLLAASSIVGTHFGTLIGLGITGLTGDAAWTTHGRCAGWTIFVLAAAIGAPFGLAHFGSKSPRAKRKEWSTDQPHEASEPNSEPSSEAAPEPAAPEPPAEPPTTGMKALLVAPAAGAFMGLIVGGILGGFLVMFYFFVALRPFGPGGWWPLLPLTSQATGDGFSTKDPYLLIPWLILVATFTLAGALLGLFSTTSVGSRRYQVFRE